MATFKYYDGTLLEKLSKLCKTSVSRIGNTSEIQNGRLQDTSLELYC